MKQKLLKLLFGVTLLTQCMLGGESQSSTENKPKLLKVEKGAVKVGENKSKTAEKNVDKTRSILVKKPNASKKNINMNIGKVEFYVK